MLPKINRLTRKEVEDIKKAQKTIIQGQYFGLIYRFKPGVAKFGVIVSNHISKKAVSRNQVKRLLCRFVKEELISSEGEFLFLAKRSSLEINPQQLREELKLFKSKIK